MLPLFQVPDQKRVRVILHSDAKIEADDQYAIVHALLTPSFIVEGIIAAHFIQSISVKQGFVTGSTVEASYQEIQKILDLMQLEEIPILKGVEGYMSSVTDIKDSDGAEFIIQQCRTESNIPLFVLCLGGLTDVAAALMKAPDITEKMTIIWIGGAAYPKGGKEANLLQDIHAANVVMASGVKVWQVPHNTYTLMRVSIAELAARVETRGLIGQYLYQQLVDFKMSRSQLSPWPRAEAWCLGDSPAIGLLLDDQPYDYTMIYAPFIGADGCYDKGHHAHKIRVYHYVDARFILEDLYGKLEMFSV